MARALQQKLPVHIAAEDLVAAGVCGLMDAAGKFKADKGATLATYARFRIRGAMLDSLRELDWAPRDTRPLIRRFQQANHELNHELLRAPTEDELAQKLGLTLGEYRRLSLAIRKWLCPPLSLSEMRRRIKQDKPIAEEVPCQRDLWPDRLHGHRELAETVAAALSLLPARDQVIMRLYYVEDIAMSEIGKRLGVHNTRISQIHAAALARLRVILIAQGIQSAAALQLAA